MNEAVIYYGDRPLDDHIPGLRQLANHLYQSDLSKPTGVSGLYAFRKVDPKLRYDPQTGQPRTMGAMNAATYEAQTEKYPNESEAATISSMSPGGNIPTIVSTQGDTAGSSPAPFTNTNPLNQARPGTLMNMNTIASTPPSGPSP